MMPENSIAPIDGTCPNQMYRLLLLDFVDKTQNTTFVMAAFIVNDQTELCLRSGRRLRRCFVVHMDQMSYVLPRHLLTY